MSRLDFAPKIDQIRVIDIKRGLGVFTPKSDKPISFAALKAALKKAGYTLDSAEIAVTGTLVRDDKGWWVEVEASKQRFALEGDNVDQVIGGAAAGTRLEISGDWQTVVEDKGAREVLRPVAAKKIALALNDASRRTPDLSGVQVSLTGIGTRPGNFLAPIRTTSPGLTVYKGGAVVPRYSFTSQHLGGLRVDRHDLRLGVSYTPSPTLQLEAEGSYSHTSFDDGASSGSGQGLGNITVWGKYRFYRALEIWGDRQAAVRFGLELPTGSKGVPREAPPGISEFVRQQLGPGDGGIGLHADAAYSQARHRVIFGANVEGTLRGERDGFRLGHEVRVNTDLEYVLLPLKYRSPTKELFVILESTALFRGRGRVSSATVPGSGSSEFYLAPGLQYVATSRLVLEASLALPLIRNSGPLALRTDRSSLFGIRYLY